MKFIKPIAVLLLATVAIAGLLAFASRLEAAELTPEQAQSIYAVAYGQCPNMAGMNAGCPPGWYEDAPIVHITHPQYGCGLMGQMPTCETLAVYADGHVFLSQDVDMSTVLGASILLHEYIHHFQWLKAGKRMTDNCQSWLANEHEAYAIEARVLEAAGQFALADYVKRISAGQRCTQ